VELASSDSASVESTLSGASSSVELVLSTALEEVLSASPLVGEPLDWLLATQPVKAETARAIAIAITLDVIDFISFYLSFTKYGAIYIIPSGLEGHGKAKY
jgi:hypothetical protein